MKLLSPEQIRAADQYTIENEPVASIFLMERAAKAFTQLFTEIYHSSEPVTIVCGSGNNGGDGLAVGRMLAQLDYIVDCYIVEISGQRSQDFDINYQRLSELVDIQLIRDQNDLPSIPAGSVIIDAIFGSGLSRPVRGIYAQVINAINGSGSDIVSIDIASGLFSDQPNPENGAIVQASKTFSFQLPKLAFFLPQNENCVGDWRVLDIGLDQQFIDQQKTDYFLLELANIKALLSHRRTFSHKGTYGHAILLTGSKGKMGAAILAARACMRSGVGLLTLQVPPVGYEIVQVAIPEAMVVMAGKKNRLTTKAAWPDHDVLGIGPGLGQHPQTAEFLYQCLTEATAPLVLDADALNILSAHSDWLELLPKGSVLTPHPKEFTRLVGDFQNDYEKLDLLAEFSKKYQVVIVLKGAYTAICDTNGQIYFNQTGNPGMATAGAGDVLTGLLTGLIAQGHSTIKAAQIGVYLHGMAGDLALIDKGEEALMASDITNYLGPAYLKVHSS